MIRLSNFDRKDAIPAFKSSIAGWMKKNYPMTKFKMTSNREAIEIVDMRRPDGKLQNVLGLGGRQQLAREIANHLRASYWRVHFEVEVK